MSASSPISWAAVGVAAEPREIAQNPPDWGTVWPGRAMRVLIAVSVIWVLNLFDLSYTLLEADGRHFRELNPVAAYLLDHPHALVMYKTSLVTIGSVILLSNRRLRLVEISSWLILAAYIYVAIRWSLYFADLHVCLSDPAVTMEPLLGVGTH